MIFCDYTLAIVILGTALLGMCAGAIGTFTFLRKQSLIGDALAHACLPGIIASCLITGSKEPSVLFLGASLAACCGLLCIHGVTHYTRIKHDTILGIVLSVFFGCGLLLISIFSKHPHMQISSIASFMFGSASSFNIREIKLIVVVAIITCTIIFLFFKEFKMISFDYQFAKQVGLPVNRLNILFKVLLVTTIIIGLQTVGVILMSTLLIAPAVAARQWVIRCEPMILLSMFFAASGAVIGSYISSIYPHVPTGPVIVLILSIYVLISIIGSRLFNYHKNYI
ncbi:metal ABC transporter permease [Vermiphilus pyriformis]|uniref:ABC transporter n=1 Tax=candidate division TM6 bacterium JCVI TM6SC1 TaxID=1306947 RepID=A0A0D2GQG4_9BACT|nr:hypothetical protein J120_01510 [candidate division TM6 bacterium JCVI TM6SC1]UNE35706.1 MAG: metal ABC transporter permease [Vermiphilus pyriformis]